MLGVLIGICVFSLVFAIVGYTMTQKFQKQGGYYYIGGPNGGGANRFFRTHPDAKKVYEAIDNHGFNPWTEKEIKKLFSMGVKAIAFASGLKGTLVITDEMALAYGVPSDKTSASGTKGQIFSSKFRKDFLDHVKFEEIMAPEAVYYTPAPQKSVIGQATVGAAVAGNVGAIVGALDALNNNIQNKDTVQANFVGEKGTGIGLSVFNFHFTSNQLILKDIAIAPQLKEEISGETVCAQIHDICYACWE